MSKQADHAKCTPQKNASRSHNKKLREEAIGKDLFCRHTQCLFQLLIVFICRQAPPIGNSSLCASKIVQIAIHLDGRFIINTSFLTHYLCCYINTTIRVICLITAIFDGPIKTGIAYPVIS